MRDTDAAPGYDPAEVMAAVDLGSNSFHLIVASVRGGQLAIVHRSREMVRLAAGLSEFGDLDKSSQDRGLDCLRRFGQILRDMHTQRVRVVGTSALRSAGNRHGFLDAAEQALGHSIQVISGLEEARLIYLGVSQLIEGTAGADLVIDIGGGSTEMILGVGHEPKHMQSLAIGCVGVSREFFDAGQISYQRFDQARLAARSKLRPVRAGFQRSGWTRAIGSSGTVRAARAIALGMGVADSEITLGALEGIIERMSEAGHLENLNLPRLSADRAPVFAGGLAILTEILSYFSIEELKVSDGALREGLLYDLSRELNTNGG